MGDVIEPKVTSWEHKNKPDDVVEDRVIVLATRLREALCQEIDPIVVRLAALGLLEAAVLEEYRIGLDPATAPETLNRALQQAKDLMQRYEITLPNGERI